MYSEARRSKVKGEFVILLASDQYLNTGITYAATPLSGYRLAIAEPPGGETVIERLSTALTSPYLGYKQGTDVRSA